MTSIPAPADDETVIGTFGTNEPYVLKHHSGKSCEPPCAFHAPSDHPLKDAPLNWRSGMTPWDGRRILERMCPHGIGHPDPDGLNFANRNLPEGEEPDEGVHGCDGCCSERSFNAEQSVESFSAQEKPDHAKITVIGKRELIPDDLIPLTGTDQHKIVSYCQVTGYEIRNLHSTEECVDDQRFVFFFGRAILDPPSGLSGTDLLPRVFFAANRELPLVSTCDIEDGELLNEDTCWEPCIEGDHGLQLSPRGRARLALILNGNTASLREMR